MSNKSKKSKMSDEEYVEYECQALAAVDKLSTAVDFVLSLFEKRHLPRSYMMTPDQARTKVLRVHAKDALDVIQSPKEVSDYSQDALRAWRAQIRRLDIIAETYLRSLYPKKQHG